MLLEFQLDWIKIVDFLLIAKFWASPLCFLSPSTYKTLTHPDITFLKAFFGTQFYFLKTQIFPMYI